MVIIIFSQPLRLHGYVVPDVMYCVHYPHSERMVSGLIRSSGLDRRWQLLVNLSAFCRRPNKHGSSCILHITTINHISPD